MTEMTAVYEPDVTAAISAFGELRVALTTLRSGTAPYADARTTAAECHLVAFNAANKVDELVASARDLILADTGSTAEARGRALAHANGVMWPPVSVLIEDAGVPAPVLKDYLESAQKLFGARKNRLPAMGLPLTGQTPIASIASGISIRTGSRGSVRDLRKSTLGPLLLTDAALVLLAVTHLDVRPSIFDLGYSLASGIVIES